MDGWMNKEMEDGTCILIHVYHKSVSFSTSSCNLGCGTSVGDRRDRKSVV